MDQKLPEASADTELKQQSISKYTIASPAVDDASNRYAIFVCAFVAFTGFFHGYDNGVTSDLFTMPSFRQVMGWPATDDSSVAIQQALVVSGSNTAAAISAVLCGHVLVDRFGRKPALIIGSILFTVGGVTQASTYGMSQLVIGRAIAGIGEGITSSAGPAYISEVSPARIRGAMVGFYQSNIVLSIIGAAMLNHLVQFDEGGWRLSLGVQVIMGGIAVVGLFFLNETPRFLESKGRSEEAFRVMSALRGGNEKLASSELDMVRAELGAEKSVGTVSWSEVLTNPHFRNVVVIGCLTQFFQIITGINAIVSYGGTLFKSLGINGIVAGLTPSIAFLVGNTLGAFALVDRMGRRPLLIWGMVGMGVSLLAGGIIGLTANERDNTDGDVRLPEAAGYGIIAAVVTYMFSFGASWGFGAWLYISEVMPLRVRGKAVGLCTGVNWGPANGLSAFVTPLMIAGPMGPAGALLLFGGVSALVVPFAATCLPETKGRTLEEITPLFRFDGFYGFRCFLRGNLRGGSGASGIIEKNSRPNTSEQPVLLGHGGGPSVEGDRFDVKETSM